MSAMDSNHVTLPESPLPWFRFYTDVTSSNVVRDLSDSEFRVLVSLMCLAGRSPGADRTTGRLTVAPIGKPVDRKMIGAEVWTHDEVEVGQALNSLMEQGLIDLDPDGAYRLVWRWHQYDSDNVTKRTRKHREQQKAPSNAAASLPGQSTTERQQKKDNRSTERSQGTDDQCDTYQCPQCAGTGTYDGSDCRWCGGSGVCRT